MLHDDPGLLSSALLDCNGSVTHRLTLLPDGQVRIRTVNLDIVVEPATRLVVRPRGAHVPEPVMAAAVTLAAELRPDVRH